MPKEVRELNDEYTRIGGNLIATMPELQYVKDSKAELLFLKVTMTSGATARLFLVSVKKLLIKTSGLCRRILQSLFTLRTLRDFLKSRLLFFFSTNFCILVLTTDRAAKKFILFVRTMWKISRSLLKNTVLTGQKGR